MLYIPIDPYEIAREYHRTVNRLKSYVCISIGRRTHSNSISEMDQQLDFDRFRLKRILMNDTQRKMIAVEGNFDGRQEPAVVVMEKYAFDETSVLNVCNGRTKLEKNLDNDVYKSFTCVPPYDGKRHKQNCFYMFLFISFFFFFSENIVLNKMDVIYPANDKHILKFTSQPVYLVQETEEMYQTITLPHIMDHSFSLQVCSLLKLFHMGNTIFIE